MSIILKLALANAWHHRVRLLLTSLAMIGAACVVVWVVSGYDALVSQFHDSAVKTMGRYDLFLMSESPKTPELGSALLAELAKDPAVTEVNPVMQVSRLGVTGPTGVNAAAGPGMPPGGPRPGMGNAPPSGGGRQPGGAPAAGAQDARSPGGPGGRMPFGPGPVLVGTDAAEPPTAVAEGKWIAPGAGHGETVLGRGLATRLQAGVGDTVTVRMRAGEFRLKVAGIVEQASVQAELGPQRLGAPPAAPRGPAASALYVPLALAEEITGRPALISLANIRLKKGTDPAAFMAAWSRRLAAAAPAAELVSLTDLETAMEQGRAATSAKAQAYSATGMSLLAALFIIFTTLSMGVNERIRQLAILRAVALTRRQVAAMIAVESMILAFIGWGGGLTAGWALLKLVAGAHPDLFKNGAALGAWCVGLTGASAFGGALAASVLPAWRATRISPLEAFAPMTAGRPFRVSVTAVVIGTLLILVNPLLVFVAPIPDAMRYMVYSAAGCTSMAVGFLLLAPLAVLIAEKLFAPLVAKLSGLDVRLLHAQLTGNLWRTLGTTISLTLGLGLFVATLTWGYTMLQPFVPGDWVPDTLVAFQSGGVPDADVEAVRHAPGILTEHCLPLAVEQPKFADDITRSEERATVTRQDNIVLIGLDPDAGLGGKDPLLDLTFVQGRRDEAVALLKQGRYCIVPDHFARVSGLTVGDRFKLLPPEAPDEPVEYTIAGVVSLPGWHWMTKFSGLRRRSGRSAAMVFADYQTVRRDFQLEKTNFFWMRTPQTWNAADVGAALKDIAERNLGDRQPVNGQGTWAAGAVNVGSSLRITTRDDVRERIAKRADGMIWGMCQLPLVTLLIASLAVMNTVMASVRARRWEMGILRSVGVTRFALIRLILAEAVLIGLVACLLSLSFGVMAGWCGSGISRYVSFFGGLDTPLVVPWLKILQGFGGTLLLCLLAALWPAVSTGRSEPLQLLQAGRASM